MDKFEHEGMTIYTTWVKYLKTKNGTKSWSQKLGSVVGTIGMTLPLIAVAHFA